ncbi:hypothetical protein BH09MYX1_BH09MYX1_64650 [soil metagenome]
MRYILTYTIIVGVLLAAGAGRAFAAVSGMNVVFGILALIALRFGMLLLVFSVSGWVGAGAKAAFTEVSP